MPLIHRSWQWIETRYEWITLAVSLLLIPLIWLESLNLQAWEDFAIFIATWTIWFWFLIDYYILISNANSVKQGVRAHWLEGIILVLTLPMSTVYLQSLRLLRLVRIVRIFKLAAIGLLMVKVEKSVLSKNAFKYAASLSVFLTIAAGLGVTMAEPKTFANPGEGIWWAITTITTVGYGDYIPSTWLGKVLAIMLMMAGLMLVAIITASIASSFVSDSEEEREKAIQEQLNLMQEQLDRMEKKLNDFR